MASGFFFDPIKLLRLAPLITSTASLTYAHDEHAFFSPWTHGSYRNEANKLLPRWFKVCLHHAMWVIGTLYPLSAISAGLNIYTATAGDTSNANVWYWSGLAFTFGHFLFAKNAIKLLNAIGDDESKGNSTQDLQEWLTMNLWRSCTVDFLAWASFLGAAMQCM